MVLHLKIATMFWYSRKQENMKSIELLFIFHACDITCLKCY